MLTMNHDIQCRNRSLHDKIFAAKIIICFAPSVLDNVSSLLLSFLGSL